MINGQPNHFGIGPKEEKKMGILLRLEKKIKDHSTMIFLIFIVDDYIPSTSVRKRYIKQPGTTVYIISWFSPNIYCSLRFTLFVILWLNTIFKKEKRSLKFGVFNMP